MVAPTLASVPATARAPVALLAAASFSSAAAMRVCDALLPRFASDFSRSTGSSGILIVGFALAYSLMQLVFGPMGDAFGKRRMVLLALAGCAVSSFAATLVGNFDMVVVLRFAWGMAAAGVVPLSMAWIGDSVAYEERQATLARLLFGTLSGMLAGQLLGGLCADTAGGWRAAFGVLTAAYAIVGIVLWRSTHGVVEAAPAAKRPAQWRVLAIPWARVVLVAVFVEGVFLIGPLAYLPAYLHTQEGLTLAAASAIAALYAAGGLIYAMFAKRIVASLGEARMSSAGGVLIAVALGGLWLLPYWPAAVVLVTLLGFGTYLFHNTLQTHATQMAPESRASAVALFAFFLFAGQSAGAAMFGYVFDRGWMAALLFAPGAVLAVAGALFASRLRARS